MSVFSTVQCTFDLCGITRVKVGFNALQTLKVHPIVGNVSEMATLTTKDNYRKMLAKLTHLYAWCSGCKSAFAPGSWDNFIDIFVVINSKINWVS